MIRNETIEEIKTRLVDVYDPISIYVFGSYAWGMPDEDSDLDVLVIVEKSEEKKQQRPVKGHLALFGLGISKDLVVYTKEEFEERTKDLTSLAYKIKHEGKEIYAKA